MCIQLSFQSAFHISLMVLVLHRLQYIIIPMYNIIHVCSYIYTCMHAKQGGTRCWCPPPPPPPLFRLIMHTRSRAVFFCAAIIFAPLLPTSLVTKTLRQCLVCPTVYTAEISRLTPAAPSTPGTSPPLMKCSIIGRYSRRQYSPLSTTRC